ncbi:hypothetical protein HYX70_03680 [Candidatus Saccharibacteria bacterium]|nr:hypothetical protein [Candidatus Saccharibacteria bacterium]
MAKKYSEEDYQKYQEMSDRHWRRWRAWGSWFSWGPPVGLGLFFLALAGAIWILTKAF